MKLRTNLEVEVGGEVAYFDFFRVKMEDEGLRIEGKSPLFAAWMKGLCKNTFYVHLPSHPWYQGEPSYYFFKGDFPPEKNNPHMGWIYQDDIHLFSDGRPNLCWLTHKDLGSENGFSILVKEPTSLNNFQDYFQQCCTSIRDIYTSCLRKASAAATFSEVWDE